MSSQVELSNLHSSDLSSYDAFSRGLFPVGVRSVDVIDQNRSRRFPCEIWYAAAPQYTGQDLDPQTQDHFTPRLGTKEQKQTAVRDALARPGIYPLIIFSHHAGGHRRVSSFLCTHLASHGYIVAAMDHSEVVAPELARQQKSETEEQKQLRWQAVIESRVPDVRFLLDQMLRSGIWQEGAEAEARIDPERIGIAGHSFGAWTALATPEVDQRIQAVVAMAPGGASNPRPGVLPVKLTFEWGRTVPALYLAAENDVPIPLAGMYELFERTPVPKQMVILRRADHGHFVDNVEEMHENFRTISPVPPELEAVQREMVPITELSSGEQARLWIRGLALAHFDAFLKQRREAQEFLAGDVKGELTSRGVDVILHAP